MNERPAGRLPENIVHFGRVLRAAGMPVGSDRILDALRAVDCIGLERREDLYAALAAIFIDRREQMALFDEAFALFWRHPRLLERALKGLFNRASGGGAPQPAEVSQRLAAALAAEAGTPREGAGETVEARASVSISEQERFRTQDFASMSTAELAAAERAVRAMRLGAERLPTRRYRPAAVGRKPDRRATMRAALRRGRDVIPLAWSARRTLPPAVVLLCDISGSMSEYSRILLQFAHALTAQRSGVHTLLFGTRLTNVTRQLRARDPDAALAAAGQQATDWSGGTRIGAALGDFNRVWARRLLAQGAVVVLVSDGLDRDAGSGIGREIRRLRRFARRILWLNPLLRYAGFAPRAAGMQGLLPHVDELRSVHDLRSLEQLGAVLAGARNAEGERDDLRRLARRG